MLQPVWRSGSVRTWIAIGTVVALSPLLLAAITGHLILDQDVIPLLQKTSSRQHDQIDPTQRLRLLIWSSVTPVEGFTKGGHGVQAQTYKTVQAEIEKAFNDLRPRMLRDPELAGLFGQAHEDWSAADSLASEALRGSGD